MKRVISFGILLAMLFTILSVFPASAENEVEILADGSSVTQSFFYDFNDGETVMEGWSGT